MYVEWSDNLQVFWSGDNGLDYIASKGSSSIYVYTGDFLWDPPVQVIDGNRRIKSVEDFDYVMSNGKKFKTKYAGAREAAV
ncbi:hypothetical protein [Jeotgalibacillus soli]|uniref:hypothetical protein n=1 Tax=Jeotgalibacillus soli TaxID=889306 RepID=UPI00059790B6|nr:hypothetical protein [Jeotgalibacillus soli]